MSMNIKIRKAGARDISHLAYIWLEASGGVIEALYEGTIPGRKTHEIVEHIFSRSATTTCFTNAIVAEEDGVIVGGLHSYSEAKEALDPPDPLIDQERLSIVQPFSELHPYGSYYIAAVAVYPKARKKGIAKLLVQRTESIAKSHGFEKISLHVFDQNNVARSFYLGLGYREEGRRSIVPHSRLRYDGDLLLMTKLV